MLFQKIANHAPLETLFEPLVQAYSNHYLNHWLMTEKGAVAV